MAKLERSSIHDNAGPRLSCCAPLGASYYLCWFSGRMYTLGPHWPGVVATLMAMSMGLYFNFTVIINSDLSTTRLLATKCIAVVLFCCSLISYLLTALTDPGLILRNSSLVFDIEDSECGSLNSQANGSCFCEPCNMAIPSGMGVRHCMDCNACIIGHDVSTAHFLAIDFITISFL